MPATPNSCTKFSPPNFRNAPSRRLTLTTLFRRAGIWRHEELILVVDDEAAVCSVTEAILNRHGYRVLVCRDGVQVIDLFRTRDTLLIAVQRFWRNKSPPSSLPATRRFKREQRKLWETVSKPTRQDFRRNHRNRR